MQWGSFWSLWSTCSWYRASNNCSCIVLGHFYAAVVPVDDDDNDDAAGQDCQGSSSFCNISSGLGPHAHCFDPPHQGYSSTRFISKFCIYCWHSRVGVSSQQPWSLLSFLQHGDCHSHCHTCSSTGVKTLPELYRSSLSFAFYIFTPSLSI